MAITERAPVSLTRVLARRFQRPVDPKARARAAAHIADWTVAATGGLGSAEGQAIRAYALHEPAGPHCVIGCGTRSMDVALLTNAALGLALEVDDVHRAARLHPGPVVIPAALAIAEHVNPTPKDLLDAVVRGYEAMIRVGMSVGATHYRYWHPTGTCGPFGAAAAAASLLDLSEDATVSALGHAGSLGAGLWQSRSEQTGSKPVHAGRGCQAGVLAARLAEKGLPGPQEILEGAAGMYAATCPDAEPARIGEPGPWAIGGTSLKPWVGCRHVHPAVDAALGLRDSNGPRLSDVERVEVYTYADALAFADDPEPASPTAAAFSLQHAVAYALLRGAPDVKAFGMEGLTDREVATMRRRVSLHEDRALSMAYPERWGARVRVYADGREREAVRRDTLGDPERPLDPSAMEQKAALLLHQAGVDDACASTIWEAAKAVPREGHAPLLEALAHSVQ